MHVMFQNIRYFHRTERAKSHMQSHTGNLHPLLFNLPKKLFGKMKPCCRSCTRPILSCIYGLVTVLVLQFMGNIRRQRHLSKLIQYLLKNSFILKLDPAVSVFCHLQNRSRQKPLSKYNSGSGTTFFSWLYQGFPSMIVLPL